MTSPAATRPPGQDGPRCGPLSLLEALELVPANVARRRGVVPLRFEDGRLVAGSTEPEDERGSEALARLGHEDALLEAMGAESFRELWDSRYGPSGRVLEFVSGLEEESAGEPSFEDPDAIADSPAPRYVRLTLEAALAEGASDVHLERAGFGPRVRFRVDGLLSERVAPPPWLFERVLGRIKALSGLALGESLFAQDGQFEIDDGEAPVSIRVSVLPGDRGECVVLRVLSRQGEVPTLGALGIDAESEGMLRRAAALPEGLIVLAGPTGSGKTTTLHSLLGTLDGDRRNIVSIEEPVEIRSPRLRQIPVRRETGLDFAGVLRSVLRQDPDVILVGETRDPETAHLVLQASLAGHLVLTTVHAAGALQIFDRFAQLGADRALLAQVLRTAVSQRLVRRTCSACGGSGCVRCDGSGYRGRLCVAEVLEMGPPMAAAVMRGEGPQELGALAAGHGFRPMTERARDLVERGETSDEEIARVVPCAEAAS
ncbi:MAG: GspE/PulE family protein [Acidobacteriota bacterium]